MDAALLKADESKQQAEQAKKTMFKLKHQLTQDHMRAQAANQVNQRIIQEKTQQIQRMQVKLRKLTKHGGRVWSEKEVIRNEEKASHDSKYNVEHDVKPTERTERETRAKIPNDVVSIPIKLGQVRFSHCPRPMQRATLATAVLEFLLHHPIQIASNNDTASGIARYH